MAQYSLDFGNYSTGDVGPASSNAWVAQRVQPAGDWKQQIVLRGDTLSGKVLSHYRASSTVAYYLLTAWSDLGYTSGDCELLAKMIVGSTWTQNQKLGPALVATTDQSYAMRRSNTNQAGLVAYSSTGGATTIGTNFAFTDLVTDDRFWVRVRRGGTTIYGKIWVDGTSEPEEWNTSGSRPTDGWSVAPGMATEQYYSAPYDMEYLGFGTGADPAPYPGGEPPGDFAALAAYYDQLRRLR